MRIWTRKSASIQPRTSLGKSDGVVASWKSFQMTFQQPAVDPALGLVQGGLEAAVVLALVAVDLCCCWSDQTKTAIFVKFLSNFSKIITNFCIQDSIFQRFSESTRFYKILSKFCQNSVKILQHFVKFLQIFGFFSENFPKD